MMERIRSPEMLFGCRNVNRKLVVMCHELLTVRLGNHNSIGDLTAFAGRIKDAAYDPAMCRGVIIKTPYGTIIVNSKSCQFQQIRDPGKLNVLASFLHQAIHAAKPLGFDDYLHTLGPEDLGVIPDFIDDFRQVTADLTKPLKRMRK